MLRSSLVLFCTLVCASSANAQQVDTLLKQSKPIGYRADRCRYEARGRRAICHGNVVVTRADLRISCRELEAEVDTRGRVVRLACRGDVEIVTAERVARSENARFDAKSEQLVLDGDARVAQGDSRLAGQAITIDIASGDISVEGRVRGVLGADVLRPSKP